MTVAQLIEALKGMPQHMEVFAGCDDEELAFEICDIKANANEVFIGTIADNLPIDEYEVTEECRNSEGKLKEIWDKLWCLYDLYYDNQDDTRLDIKPTYQESVLGKTYNFELNENGNWRDAKDFLEVKAFVEKYADYLVVGDG